MENKLMDKLVGDLVLSDKSERELKEKNNSKVDSYIDHLKNKKINGGNYENSKFRIISNSFEFNTFFERIKILTDMKDMVINVINYPNSECKETFSYKEEIIRKASIMKDLLSDAIEALSKLKVEESDLIKIEIAGDICIQKFLRAELEGHFDTTTVPLVAISMIEEMSRYLEDNLKMMSER